MKMINTAFYRFCLVFLGFSLGLFSVASAAFLDVSDVSAGEKAQVRMSGLLSEESTGFELLRPDGTSIFFNGIASDLGVLNADIFGLHLRKNGKYKLKAVGQYSLEKEVVTHFNVFPGTTSAYRSKIVLQTSTLPANGEAFAPFKVFVKDAYGNPVSDRNIQIVSSRNEDVVVSHGLSNKQGIVKGKITSKTPGISVLSVLIDDVVVFEKPEIVFHLAANGLGNVGASGNLGSFLKAQLFEEGFEEVAYFAIEELPAEVITDRNYTFKLIAKDQNGDIVKNYLGTARFSSSDNEAVLPVNYTFTKEDQGEHSFALAVTFGTAGQQELVVNDTNNLNIKGNQIVQVFDEDRVGGGGENEALTIITPLSGTYSVSRMTITGKGVAGKNIKLLDGPTTLIEDLVIDSEGGYTYQTPNLADGRHKFVAVYMDGSVLSNEVSILVDQTPPRVLAVEVEPAGGVDAGSVFQVKVSSNEPLASATCVFNEASQDLRQSGSAFVGNYQAPKVCGEYPVACVVADLMGNELEESNATTVQVCTEDGGNDEKDTDGDKIPDKVEGYEADDDEDCVKNWLESKIADSDGDGINDQADPDNDTDGGGTDNTLECKSDNTDPLNPDDDSGKKNSGVGPTAVFNLSARGGEKKATLYWSPAKDDKGVAKYKIFFSTNPENLAQQDMTPDARTQWYIDGLQDGTKYFFKVLAIDVDGNEGVLSNLAEATTNGDSLHSSAVPRSGNNYLWPFLFALIGGSFFLVLSRSKRV